MKSKLIVLLLVLISFISATEIPFLQRRFSTSAEWTVSESLFEKLSEFYDRELHVIAVSGPTSSGKSFIMSNLIKQFTTHHFGDFKCQIDGNVNAYTNGINVALVEHLGNLILLIDSEGLNSNTAENDANLMMMLSMISQKIIYLTNTTTIRTSFFTEITGMLEYRDKTGLGKDYFPLDTLFTILNRSKLKNNFRDEQFIETSLWNRLSIKAIFDRAYKNRKLFFIGVKNENELVKFETDLALLFKNIIESLPDFTIDRKVLTVHEYVRYIQNVIVPYMNDPTIRFNKLEENQTFTTYVAMENTDEAITVALDDIIVSAWYGHPSDVKKRIDIRDKIRPGNTKFDPKSEIWGNPATDVTKVLSISVIKRNLNLVKKIQLNLVKIGWRAVYTILANETYTQSVILKELQQEEVNARNVLTNTDETTDKCEFNWKVKFSAGIDDKILGIKMKVEGGSETQIQDIARSLQTTINSNVKKTLIEYEKETASMITQTAEPYDRVIYFVELTGQLSDGEYISTTTGFQHARHGIFTEPNCGRPPIKDAYQLLNIPFDEDALNIE